MSSAYNMSVDYNWSHCLVPNKMKEKSEKLYSSGIANTIRYKQVNWRTLSSYLHSVNCMLFDPGLENDNKQDLGLKCQTPFRLKNLVKAM